MFKLTLNPDGQLARLYQWSYNESLPNDLCSYFWKLVFSVLAFSVTWLTYPWDYYIYCFRKRVFGGLALLALLAAVSGLITSVLLGEYALIIAIGMIILFLVGIVVAIFVFSSIPDAVSYVSKIEIVSESIKIIKERKLSVKERWCPQIEWKRG